MNLRLKKRLTFITIATNFLLGGIEYAVILPTVWLFLSTRFQSSVTMMGIVITAFQLPGLLLSPFMGYLSDRTGKTKLLLLVCNMFEVGGSVMYFVATSQWFVVAGRLVAGCGPTVTSAIFADISRITSPEERTGVFSVFMSARMLGLLIGPSFNLFLRHFDFHIGPYHIDKYTAPGLFMACVWALHQLQCVFMYWDLRQFIGMNSAGATPAGLRADDNQPPVASINSHNGYGSLTGDTSSDDRGLLSADEQEHDHHSCTQITNTSAESDTTASAVSPPAIRMTRRFFYDEYIREEIVTILATVFLSWFNQMSLETMLTPLSKRLLGWGELENSIFYCVAGGVVMIGFAVIRALSRFIEDRKLLLFGVLLLTVEPIILLICCPRAQESTVLYVGIQEDDPSNIYWLMACATVGLISLPFIFVTFPSLYSKLTREETQGFSQGLRRVVVGLAAILGPLWAGSLLQTQTQQYVLFSVMIALQILVIAMVLLSFKRLKTSTFASQDQRSNSNSEEVEAHDERSPLLGGVANRRTAASDAYHAGSVEQA